MPVDYRDAGRGRSPLIICGLVAFVLQVALGSQISFFGGCLNFMAAFACAAALQGDSGAAAITGSSPDSPMIFPRRCPWA